MQTTKQFVIDLVGEWKGCTLSEQVSMAKTVFATAVSLASLFVIAATYVSQHKNLRRSQRPWVSITYARVGPLKVGSAFEADVQIENSGNTPVQSQTLTSSGATITRKLGATDAAFEEEGNKHLHDISNLLPHPTPLTVRPPHTPLSIKFLAQNNAVTDQVLRSFNDGSIHVYRFGTVKYTDIFGDLHETHFCFFFGKDTDSTIHAPGIVAHTCSAWNDVT